MKNKISGGGNIHESHDNNKPKEREVSTGVKQKKEKEDAASMFSKEEGTENSEICKKGKDNTHASSEDISSYSEDETTQPPFQKEMKYESDISPGEGKELRAIHDTSSRAQTRADRPNTILFKKGMTNLNGYPKDTDHPAVSEKRMDANLAPKKDNNANVKIKENRIQRTLSRTV